VGLSPGPQDAREARRKLARGRRLLQHLVGAGVAGGLLREIEPLLARAQLLLDALALRDVKTLRLLKWINSKVLSVFDKGSAILCVSAPLRWLAM
jgi:hypothetical protein